MINSSDTKQGVYIDLDALLDTRLGTIIDNFGQDKAISILSNGYFTRKSNTFEGITLTEFENLYALRTKKVLLNSMVTKVMRLLVDLVATMNKQAITSPLHSGPKVYINIYPYKLNELEVNTILKCVVLSCNKACDVVMINTAPENLTPQYCKNTFAVMFKYDYSEWFEKQAANFDKARCPGLTCFVPAMYFVREPTKEELEKFVKEDMHPLSAIEMASSVFIDLKLYETEYFCANIANDITTLKSYKNA